MIWDLLEYLNLDHLVARFIIAAPGVCMWIGAAIAIRVGWFPSNFLRIQMDRDALAFWLTIGMLIVAGAAFVYGSVVTKLAW